MAKKRVSETDKEVAETKEETEQNKEVIFLRNAFGSYGYFIKEHCYEIPEGLANSFIAEKAAIEK